VELSRTNDAQPLTLAEARATYSYSDFPSFLLSFKAVTERLHTPADYETITYAMLRDLALQGVRHAEAYISIGILYYFGRLDVDEVMAAIERGRVRGEHDFGISAAVDHRRCAALRPGAVRARLPQGRGVEAPVSERGRHRHRRR
jgi:aminodeoxyfutalosine deaminase